MYIYIYTPNNPVRKLLRPENTKLKSPSELATEQELGILQKENHVPEHVSTSDAAAGLERRMRLFRTTQSQVSGVSGTQLLSLYLCISEEGLPMAM